MSHVQHPGMLGIVLFRPLNNQGVADLPDRAPMLTFDARFCAEGAIRPLEMASCDLSLSPLPLNHATRVLLKYFHRSCLRGFSCCFTFAKEFVAACGPGICHLSQDVLPLPLASLQELPKLAGVEKASRDVLLRGPRETSATLTYLFCIRPVGAYSFTCLGLQGHVLGRFIAKLVIGVQRLDQVCCDFGRRGYLVSCLHPLTFPRPGCSQG